MGFRYQASRIRLQEIGTKVGIGDALQIARAIRRPALHAHQVPAGARHVDDAGIVDGTALDADDVAGERWLVRDVRDRPFERQLGAGGDGLDEAKLEPEPDGVVALGKKGRVEAHHQRDDVRPARDQRAERARPGELLVVMQRVVVAAKRRERPNRRRVERRPARKAFADAEHAALRNGVVTVAGGCRLDAEIVHVSRPARGR
jgi:hypothetical protein